MCIHSETRTRHDKNIQSNAPYRYVLTTQLHHVTNLGKGLTVRLLTKWLLIPMPLQSLKLRNARYFWRKEFFEIQETIERGFALKRLRDVIKR